jgi:hypothetical protein
MARQQKLKVFRTPIGFHDAYVAATSRKAALTAWGTDRDLFARGVAEQVDDPKLMEEPLAKPGVVIRRSRGTLAEQIAALPQEEPQGRRSQPRPEAERKAASPKQKPKPKPRPRRDRLSAAEDAVADAEQRHRQALAALARRERALADERRRIEREQSHEQERLRQRACRERAAYDDAMRDWEG